MVVPSIGGPARRMYSLTSAGSLFLQNWLTILDTHKAMVEHLLTGQAAPTNADSRKKPPSKRSRGKTAQPQEPPPEHGDETA